MYHYQLLIDKKSDARNRYRGLTTTQHGCHRIDRLDVSLYPHGTKEFISSLYGISKDDAIQRLNIFLHKVYEYLGEKMDEHIYLVEDIFSRDFQDACHCMEHIMAKKLYKNTFSIYVTTFPRGPYDYRSGSMRLCLFWPPEKWTGYFLHELMHFQFIHYYKESAPITSLTDDQFEFFKEAMTILLNVECNHLLVEPDRGYAIHQEFRNDLLRYRCLSKDFEKFVTYGSRQVTKYIN